MDTEYISKSIYDDENNSEQEMKSYLWKSLEVVNGS